MRQSCQLPVVSHPYPWSPTPQVVTKNHPAPQKIPIQNITATAIPIIRLQMERTPPQMGQSTQLSMANSSKTLQ